MSKEINRGDFQLFRFWLAVNLPLSALRGRDATKVGGVLVLGGIEGVEILEIERLSDEFVFEVETDNRDKESFKVGVRFLGL